MIKAAILRGALGRAVRRTVEERFKKLDCRLLEEPFALRNETDNAWRCEFWGKVLRSAVAAAAALDDAELKAMISQSVRRLMSTQTPDGCISSYPGEKQLKGWDVWGRKYVLLALIRYYEMLDPDPAVLQCCCRMADHLMEQIGPEEGKKSILEAGQHNGLASASILGAFVALWRLTGAEKYRAFAEYIISSGCSTLGNIYEDIAVGIMPSAVGNGKAYELTSCVQGAVELELLESRPGVAEMAKRYYATVRDREIFITGVGGAKDSVGEFWFDGALRQTRAGVMGLGETCIIATWLRFCADMLQLTDDPTVADEMEKSLYNGILGALAPDGTHWMHMNPTPLTGGGFKAFAPDQMGRNFGKPFGGNDCCRAQGPEGLVTALLMAVTEKENTLTVNLFEPLSYVPLVIEGDYPRTPEVLIRFTEKCTKRLRLRTPEFLEKVTLNGKEIPFEKGVYLVLSKEWEPDDKVLLEFDFTLKEIPAPDGSPFVAVKRGPLVLAADSRGTVPGALVNTVWRGIPLCDYATAGNEFNEANTLQVWFPEKIKR
jgi:DUF1680 family protein